MHDVTAKTFRSGPPTSGTESLVLDIGDDTGAAHEGHPNTWFKAFNYDLAEGVLITFDTLFKPGTDPLAVLNPIVQQKFGTHPESPISTSTRPLTKISRSPTTRVIFFFAQDQVVPDNKGPQQISVPRSELAPLLA